MNKDLDRIFAKLRELEEAAKPSKGEVTFLKRLTVFLLITYLVSSVVASTFSILDFNSGGKIIFGLGALSSTILSMAIADGI